MRPRIFVPAAHLYGELDPLVRVVGYSLEGANDILLDLSNCDFLSDAGAVVLAAFKLRREQLGFGTNIDWNTVKDGIGRQLRRWQIASYFGEQNTQFTDTAIPLLHQQKLEPKGLVEYVETNIVQSLPRMTSQLARETQKAVCEVFTNIFQHAESSVGGLAIGQLYPNRHQFQLCFFDAGVGLVRKVQDHIPSIKSPIRAIQWALSKGNSTLNQPGGLGLFLLREFVRANRGFFRIYANNGCLTENAGYQQARTVQLLDGTLISLRLNLRDDVVYDIR